MVGRFREERPKRIKLGAQVPLPSRLQLLFDDRAVFLRRALAVDLLLERLDVLVRDSLLEEGAQAAFKYLREASELLLDERHLADQRFQDAILRALLEHEVVATDDSLALQLAVDATVPLFHPARIP